MAFCKLADQSQESKFSLFCMRKTGFKYFFKGRLQCAIGTVPAKYRNVSNYALDEPIN
jgi:hypothetical protein